MTVLIISTVASWTMVGLIWLIQIVHYPMLETYSEQFPGDALADHQRRITYVVGPPMAAEGVTALWLLVTRPDTMSLVNAWVAAALLGVALLSTVLLQVPLHQKLAEQHDPLALRRLISTNWIRTIAWTLRGVVLAAVLAT